MTAAGVQRIHDGSFGSHYAAQDLGRRVMFPVMPFYLCIDATEHQVAAASVCREMQAQLTQACAGSDAAEVAQLGVVAFGASAAQIIPLGDLERPEPIQDFDLAKPLQLSSVYELLDPLISHDVSFYKANGVTVLRPVVATLLFGPSRGQYDYQWFEHLTTQAPVNPLVISLGAGDATEDVVAAHQTAGAWMADPAPVKDQIQMLLSNLLVPMIIRSAERTVAGAPSVAFPDVVSRTRRIA